MRESLGGSLLLNLVIIFAGIVMVFFVGILSYSKAYRIKNRIIEVIEKHEKYDESVAKELASDLQAAGYSTAASNCDKIRENLVSGTNPKYDGTKLKENLNSFGYNYCVFESENTKNGNYYVVITFTRFEFPVIDELLTFPVYGETKILGKEYDY